MRGGTGKIILWSLVSVVGATWVARKVGVNVPGLS